MPRVYHTAAGGAACERRSGPRALCTLLLLLGMLVPRGADGCGGKLSRCVNLEPIWAAGRPSPFVVAQGDRGAVPQSHRGYLNLISSWQHRPLEITVAAPDPFGRRLPIVENWLVTQAAYGVPVFHSWRVGVGLSAGWLASGTGLVALRSQAARDPVRWGLGDPRLFTSWDLKNGKISGAWTYAARLAQHILLPFGSEQSWLHSRSLTYSPVLALSASSKVWSAALELGLRSRRAVTLGDARFGSSGWAAIGIGRELGAGFMLTAEAWSAPSLELSESLVFGRRTTLRPIPTEWLVGVSHTTSSPGGSASGELGNQLRLGVGGSIPLSSWNTDAAEQRWVSGPPAPSVRALIQFAHQFRE